MKPFIHDNFLLANAASQRLFHDLAKAQPVVDYHNHLSPSALAGNIAARDMTELWIDVDPYKHRAMRINGIAEEQITGSASPKDKFFRWAETVPQTLGNPLFHWTALELKRFFGIDDLLSPKTAESIWNHCNEQISAGGYGALDVMRKCGVETLCTSDDLLDDLSTHERASAQPHGINVLPSLRADSILAFGQPTFADWLRRLDPDIGDYTEYQAVVMQRLEAFHAAGCRLADHALDNGFAFTPLPDDEAATLFRRVLRGERLPRAERIGLQSSMLRFLGDAYASFGWIMELHIGAQRTTSSRLRDLVGSAGGYATIGNSVDIISLCRFLDTLEQNNRLPRTILFTLNPIENAALAVLTGSYAEDGVAGKIQFGPAWWYNDHLDGIRQQLTALSNYGLLSRFVGFTTDSRSVLSFSRHEYFRRVLCDLLGSWIEARLLPDDEDLIATLIHNLTCGNARRWISRR